MVGILLGLRVPLGASILLNQIFCLRLFDVERHSKGQSRHDGRLRITPRG